MKKVTYGLVVLGLLGLATLFGWLPQGLLNPVRALELRVMFHAWTQGPSGLDDTIQSFAIANPNRYARPIMFMLRNSQPGSKDEEVALFFVELVRGMGELDSFLVSFAEQHPDEEIRGFVQEVLSQPIPNRNSV